jgi:polysaccharide pyruvyl transferase WcaK-like protein
MGTQIEGLEMKVIHIYADANGNWGDRALARGVQEIFMKHLGIQSQDFQIIPLESLSKEQNKLSNQDLIIYGGGGILGELIAAYCGFLSSFPSPTVGYGVGLNRFIVTTGKEEPFKTEDVKILSYVVKRDFKYFSVRNDGSKEKLLSWGYEPPLPESPDPGIWSGLNLTPQKTTQNYVIIQLAGDMLLNRFYYDAIDMVKFTRKINVVKNFLNKKGYDVVFAVHREEDTLFKRFITGQYEEWNWREVMNNIPKGLESYKNAKFVLGMRGHSQILPFGLGVPSIALVNQSKNLGFMQKVGLERYAVKIKEKNLDILLKEKILELENEYPSVQSHIQSQLQTMEKNVTEEFKIIKERLKW